MVTAPIGSTRASAPRAASSTLATIGGASIAGLVLGIAQTVVKPPRAAAAVPLAIVSLCSSPGVRRCVCRSTNPGATTSPPASICSSPAPTASSAPNSATRPSRMRRSSVASSPAEGSITRPPRSSTFPLMSHP